MEFTSITSNNLGGNLMSDAGLISVRDGKIIAETVKAVRNIPGLEGYIDRFKSASAQGASQNTVAILNDTGADLPVFSIVRIDKTVTTTTRGGSATTADNYKNLETYVWTATSPDEGLTGQYAILQTQTPINEIGEALLVGVSKVRLDDTDEGDYAEPQYNDIEKMKTSGAGRFPVLVVATPASDDTWGYILLISKTTTTIQAKITDHDSTDWFKHSWEEVELSIGDDGVEWTTKEDGASGLKSDEYACEIHGGGFYPKDTIVELTASTDGDGNTIYLFDGSAIKWRVRLQAIAEDYLTFKTWDGTSEGTETIYAAKPFALQKTAWNGIAINGVTYTYAASPGVSRSANDGVDTETQLITPDLETPWGSWNGQEFTIIIRHGGTGIEYSGHPLIWQTLNDGISWAAECPEE